MWSAKTISSFCPTRLAILITLMWRLQVALLVAAAVTPSGALQLGALAAGHRAPVAARAPAMPRTASLQMQEGPGGGAGERESKCARGRTAVVQRPKPKPKFDRKEDVEMDKTWRVLVHNDDVHTFDYVTMAIVKVVKTITRKKAHRITVQCHSMGTATVTTTWKAMAKTMCLKLQKFGLTSSIAPDQ